MAIDSNMIQENDVFEEQCLRANLEAFIVAQEAEALRCQQLRERAAGASRSSATGGNSASVSVQESSHTSPCLILCSP
jgi:hypothetical protein